MKSNKIEKNIFKKISKVAPFDESTTKIQIPFLVSLFVHSDFKNLYIAETEKLSFNLIFWTVRMKKIQCPLVPYKINPFIIVELYCAQN